MLVLSAKGQEIKNHKDTQLKFEVLSIRLMADEERSDNIAQDTSVKLRLSNTGNTAVYYYTSWKGETYPYGHVIKETGKGIVWFKGFETVSDKTLGISPNRTLGDGGDWIILPPGGSIEWESGESTIGAGGKHAKTIFMKAGPDGEIVEVYSDFYTVPAEEVKSKSYKDTQLKFEVLSVKPMPPVTEEKLEQGDNTGQQAILVKFRLTNTGKAAIYYYTGRKDKATPYGHAVKQTEKGIAWSNKGWQNATDKSLGISQAIRWSRGAAWVKLPPKASIEWETEEYASGAGEKQAGTIFMKVGEEDDEVEVYSDFYTVPANEAKNLAKKNKP
jgi:hypothetical protein